MEKVTIITDLGPGDGGKGTIVHFLAHHYHPSIIIKRGGAQGSHGICTSDHEKFNFSQWGCGTFEGIPTYCSEQMVLSLVGLYNESEALKHWGISEPFWMLSVDPECVCASPFHLLASQIEELRLKESPRGTVGTGVGQAYRMAAAHDSQLTIYAKDLLDLPLLRRKLSNQRDFYLELYCDLTESDVLPDDQITLWNNLASLRDPEYIPYHMQIFREIGEKINFLTLEQVLKRYPSALVECSHGVLTDAVEGLVPHVSAIRTLPQFTQNMFRRAGFEGDFCNLAVHRAYNIRHGAGPLPTYDPLFTKCILPYGHKDKNRWQGEVRAGALDLTLLSYALSKCQSEQGCIFDGICLTCFDHILENWSNWPVCMSYKYTHDVCAASNQLSPKDFTKSLQYAVPNVESCQLQSDSSNPSALFREIATVLNEWLNLPLKVLSLGPTELDKLVDG